ncbi:MAG: hypothetical protein K0Q59_4191 [Paenibacillus sp.]|nr:hypothetical protein [Paenibacillus sp.]
MSHICLYCNGLLTLELNCASCGERLSDAGRLDDYVGPYSPYRAIEDQKLTNGYLDAALHLCVHHVYCSHCGYEAVVQMKESRTLS